VHAAAHPEAWAALRSEPGRYVAPYVDETLRLTPAVWGIPRVPACAGLSLTSDGVVARVPRTHVVNVYLRALNRDPKVWADPLAFDPARHLTAGPREQRALLPFGLGPRGCIGQQLALAEMYAVLPALAGHGDVIVDRPVEEDPRFALRIAGGLRGRFVAA
jgi:cytochrome P450